MLLHELDYAVFLNTVSKYFEIRRLCDYSKLAEDKVCLLRHDVDKDMERAIRMAEIEYDFHARSTYFVLHTAGYYKESGFLDKCRYLQDMGHEIGLHNNILTACIAESYLTPQAIFDRELAYLRSGGLDIRGTASHGDKLCYELNYINYQIFKGCEVKNRPLEVSGFKFYEVDMDGFYEAYHIPRDFYVSDSASRWAESYSTREELKVPLSELEKINDILEYIRAIGKLDRNFTLQVLAHPCWWEL